MESERRLYKLRFYGRFSSSEIHDLIHDLKTSLMLPCLGQTKRGQVVAGVEAQGRGGASVCGSDGGGR